MTSTQSSSFRPSAAQYVIGAIGVALLPFACLRVELDFPTTAFVYLFLFTLLLVTRLLKTARERTEEAHKAEAALRRSEAYLRDAQTLSRTGSFTWDLSTGEVSWSEEMFRTLQYDRSIKLTLDLALQRVHPEDAPLVKQILERASRDGEDFDYEHRLLMPEGTVKHVRLAAHAPSA